MELYLIINNLKMKIKKIKKTIKNFVINVIIYLQDFYKTTQIVRKSQIKERAYNLLENELNQLVSEYIYTKINNVELTTTRYTMTDRATLYAIKKWLDLKK
jgi:cupin superfamily acireductone dioxygenase involved in methionine salvage